MIRYRLIHSRLDKEALLDSFDPFEQQWIVSDLKSKQEIQNRLLARYGCVPGECVLRASELWRKWLGHLSHSYRVVSPAFLVASVAEYLEHKKKFNKENN